MVKINIIKPVEGTNKWLQKLTSTTPAARSAKGNDLLASFHNRYGHRQNVEEAEVPKHSDGTRGSL